MKNFKPGITKGQLESELGNALVQFEKNYMGRGPQETRAYIIDDMILLRLKGVLTPAEQKLANTEKGRELIKNMRSNLLEEGRELLSQAVEEITGIKVLSLHTDVSTKTGERMIIFSLSENLGERFPLNS